ncbi:GntR family transcriptional regulator [uncultured Alistipes sp.]|uniref:GntR family transcriptional regulator n=1 Tax=Alistipes sp. TaxID=1872444 RepID=UPI00262D9ADC|nr:GntR family transcriptional regulator [uncultured Alistipes sp.]
MQFNDNQPIWLQIYDYICRGILSGKWPEQERLPSVRELAANLQVNPNTVMRTYEKLESDALISNRRGIGFFVNPDARTRTLEAQRHEFLTRELPALFRRMEELGLDTNMLRQLHERYKQEQHHENKQ